MKTKIVKEKSTYYKGRYLTWYYRYSLMSENGELLSSIDVEEETLSDKVEYISEYKDKKVLYLTSFRTVSQFRNQGYGKYLLEKILNRFKGKYELIHLNACPYYEIPFNVKYKAPENGLQIRDLVKFYECFGFKKHYIKRCDDHIEIIMLLESKKG